MHVALIFPNQLFENSPLLDSADRIYLIEEFLFFKQYRFHKQKIAFHRATMKFYEEYLDRLGKEIIYINAYEERSDIRILLKDIPFHDPILIYDPVDDWLKKRIITTLKKRNIDVEIFENPLFLNSRKDNATFFRADKKKFFQTSFYKLQRHKYNLLMDQEKPLGGQWTFDVENRKPFPKNRIAPEVHFPDANAFYIEAFSYTDKYFSNHPGEMVQQPYYPCTFSDAKNWLNEFLKDRFEDFGTYEDAIVAQEIILHHSVLSPLMNVGLLTSAEIIQKTIYYIQNHEIPINSTEGFIRQIIGWREFIRGIYEVKGRFERTRNFWTLDRKMPSKFYDASTGIPPIDNSIMKVLKTGYCHHIERLMILGNFMLLCEIAPDEIYTWFMELFIDAYDWVMVPNVYGMSQFADGGLMSTKPYISSSNYILKMSNYSKGPWCEIWDAFYWNFINKNASFFMKNPRMKMQLRLYDKMALDKKEKLKKIHGEYSSFLFKNA